jgi:hypothetical protein
MITSGRARLQSCRKRQKGFTLRRGRVFCICHPERSRGTLRLSPVCLQPRAPHYSLQLLRLTNPPHSRLRLPGQCYENEILFRIQIVFA